jgi:hypothetical protein
MNINTRKSNSLRGVHVTVTGHRPVTVRVHACALRQCAWRCHTPVVVGVADGVVYDVMGVWYAGMCTI